MAPSFLAGLYLSAGKEVSQKACGGEFYSFPLVSSVNEFRRMELELSAVGTKKGCWPDRHHAGDFGPAASLRALSDSEARRTNRQTGIPENNI